MKLKHSHQRLSLFSKIIEDSKISAPPVPNEDQEVVVSLREKNSCIVNTLLADCYDEGCMV